MPFNAPMVWHERSNHFGDCCFCFMNTDGYLLLDWFPHRTGLPMSTPPLKWNTCDCTYSPQVSGESHHIFQNELNDLVHDLDLLKQQIELFSSRL